MIIEQAIFGIKPGRGHGLIDSTIEKNQLKQVKTDFFSNINSYSDWEPYYRTQLTKNYFLFLKTYPDKEQDRRGSVFTHVLAIKKTDIHLVDNLNDIFSLFKDKKEQPTSIASIHLNPTTFTKSNESLVHKVIHYIVQPQNSKKSIVWMDKDMFLPMIAEFWSLIPKYARQSFTFGFSPKPVDLAGETPYIVYTNQINSWNDYPVVRNGDVYSLNTPAELFLLGVDREENNITVFLDELRFEIRDFSKLHQIQIVANDYLVLDSLSLQKTIHLFQRIANLVPSVEQGIEIKNNILNRLLELIANANIDEITGTGNLKVNSIQNAENKIKKAIETRLSKELKNSTNTNNELYELLIVFFENIKKNDNHKHWWYIVIKSTLTSFFQRRGISSKVIWALWEADIRFVEWLNSYLINEYVLEKILAGNTPLNLSKELGNAIRVFSAERKWLLLHGSVLSTYLPALEAFKLQLKIDTETGYSEALNIIAEKASAKEIIDTALSFKDERLLPFVGKASSQDSSFFSQIDFTDIYWQKIWLESVEYGNKIDAGFKNPQADIYRFFDVILNSSSSESKLLEKISSTKYANILDYSHRETFWNKLTYGRVRNKFLMKTGNQFLIHLFTGTALSIRPDRTLANYVINDAIPNFLDNNPNEIQKALIIFKINGIEDRLIRDYIINHDNQIDIFSAKQLGELIRKKESRFLAESIDRKTKYGSNWHLALAECYQLLGFFRRMSLSFDDLREIDITEDEWWKNLKKIITNLYDNRNSMHTIWTKASGDKSDFLSDGTVKEIWHNAITELRKGKFDDISVESLLEEIRKDYKNNEEFKMLYKYWKKINK